MKKLIIPILLFSAVLFSCKKEIITLDSSDGFSSDAEYFETKASGSYPSCNNPEGGDGDNDVITDPNNDSDEDKRRKGKAINN